MLLEQYLRETLEFHLFVVQNLNMALKKANILFALFISIFKFFITKRFFFSFAVFILTILKVTFKVINSLVTFKRPKYFLFYLL